MATQHDTTTEQNDETGADQQFVVPEMLSKARVNQDAFTLDVWMAARKHAKHLAKAEDRITKATALAETLRCALLSDRYDPESVADEVVDAIIRHLNKAQKLVDRHETDHGNLFMAYFEKDRPEDSKVISQIMAGIEDEPPEQVRAFADIVKLVATHGDRAIGWLNEARVSDDGQRRAYSEVRDRMVALREAD